VTREFLGEGWGFPVTTAGDGAVATAAHEADVADAIRIVLGTAKGERVMRPDFGCGVHEYVFAAINTSTLTLIESSVREALVRWEPRIEVLSVTASRAELTAGRLPISIDYRVRATNTERNLVYPFYLGEGDGQGVA
jgi:hypothetical protein